jgi:hypothetical protein
MFNLRNKQYELVCHSLWELVEVGGFGQSRVRSTGLEAMLGNDARVCARVTHCFGFLKHMLAHGICISHTFR